MKDRIRVTIKRIISSMIKASSLSQKCSFLVNSVFHFHVRLVSQKELIKAKVLK